MCARRAGGKAAGDKVAGHFVHVGLHCHGQIVAGVVVRACLRLCCAAGDHSGQAHRTLWTV